MERLIKIQKSQLSVQERMASELYTRREQGSGRTSPQPSLLTSPFLGAFADEENILG